MCCDSKIRALILEYAPLSVSFFASSSSKSSVKKNVVPSPGSLSKSSCPPISSINRAEMVRPRPVPPYFRVIEVSAWEKASNIFDFCSLVTPIPLSCTSNLIRVTPSCTEGCFLISTFIAPELLVNLTAFERRLIRTSLIFVGSPLSGCSSSGSIKHPKSICFSLARTE